MLLVGTGRQAPGAAGACPGGTGLAVRGRCAGSTRGAIGRRPPCPPGVSYPASASPLGPPAKPGHPGALGPWGSSPFPAGPTRGPGGTGEPGGPGGPAPRGWTLVGPRGCPGYLLIAVCVVRRLGRGAPGVRGVPWGPPCPPLQDVGGRHLVVHRGYSVHRVPRQVFQHCPACVVLVCTQGTFRWFRGPSRRGERHRLPDGALCRWFEGQVGQWNRVWRQRAARGRRIEGLCRVRGPETPDGMALRVCLQPRLPVRGADLADGFAPPSQVVEGL